MAVEVQAARQAVVILEDVLGVTRSYRWVGDINVGADYEHETDHRSLLGPTLGWTLRILNWGCGRIARAQAKREEYDACRGYLEALIAPKQTGGDQGGYGATAECSVWTWAVT